VRIFSGQRDPSALPCGHGRNLLLDEIDYVTYERRAVLSVARLFLEWRPHPLEIWNEIASAGMRKRGGARNHPGPYTCGSMTGRRLLPNSLSATLPSSPRPLCIADSCFPTDSTQELWLKFVLARELLRSNKRSGHLVKRCSGNLCLLQPLRPEVLAGGR